MMKYHDRYAPETPVYDTPVYDWIGKPELPEDELEEIHSTLVNPPYHYSRLQPYLVPEEYGAKVYGDKVFGDQVYEEEDMTDYLDGLYQTH